MDANSNDAENQLTEDAAKDFVTSRLVFPDYDLLKLIEKADSGCVVWLSQTPQGVNYQTHKFSFIDAIMHGLKFCQTDCIGDWATLGGSALALVRTLPQFCEKPERSCGKINFVGKLGGILVYAYPTAKDNSFWVGHGSKCCVGFIQDE